MVVLDYNLYDVLRYPVLTEKASNLGEQVKYTFFVLVKADKALVTKAVEQIYNVEVERVNIINLKGKVKRTKNTLGTRAARKKAIVTLAQGHTIDFKTLGA